MKDVVDILKMAGNYGVLGLMMVLIYRLVDKWAPQFLAAHQDQAKAMASLATAVKEGQGEQREILLAVRVLATKIEQQGEAIEGLDEHVRKGLLKGAAV